MNFNNTMIELITNETTLETSRLLLEPLIESHAAYIYRQLQDQRLYQFIPQEAPTSLQILEARYRALSSRLSPNEQEAWLNWAVRLRQESTYIGTLEATVYKNLTATIAYMIFPPFWQQNYAKEGCSILLNHLLNDYKVNAIAAEIDTRNIPSIQLIKSLGFTYISKQENVDSFKGCVSHEYKYECVSSPVILSHKSME